MIKLQSERCFRALIESSSDAVLLADAGAKIIYANPSAGKLLGHDPQQIMNMAVLDLIHPNDRAFIEKSFGLSESTGELPVEIRLQHTNGSWLWLECTPTNLLHEPEVEGVFLTLRDITDRKEAQHNLQTQRDLLLNLVAIAQATGEAAELGKVLYNLVKIGKWLTLANSGSVFLFDKLGAQLYTTSYHGRLDPGRVHRLLTEGISAWVLQNNRPALVMDTLTDERWLELVSGSDSPRSALAVPIHGDQDVVAILLLTHPRPNHFNDDHVKTLLAANSQMAAALRNAQLYNEAQSNLADMSALIESSQDGLLLINPEGRMRIINTAALKLVGLSGKPSNWIDRPIIELLRRLRRTSPKLVRTLIAELNRVKGGDNSPAGGELPNLSCFIKWVHMPIVQNERVLGRLVVLRDTTDQNKLTRQREELTNMIVHDLRNPASAVAGIVSMIKSLNTLDEIPDDFEQMMQLAERNVSKILELIQEILDVSQLENGQLPVKKEPVQLMQLIEDTLQLQRPIISMKEMNLEANIQPDLPDVWADERLIRRVLQNLVDNAAKFSRRQSNITLAAQISAENSDWIQVSVQDYGVGIPTEMKNLVFEKFVTNRHTQRGSGIGLTFCRLAIEAHNGRIWAESEENLGSTFYFTLPIAQAA